MWWLPQLGIGVAVLTNSTDHQLPNDLALSIFDDLVAEPGPYCDGLLALPRRSPVTDPVPFSPPADMARLVADAAMPATGDEAQRWAAYDGLYRLPERGIIDVIGPPDRFLVGEGVPYFEAEDPWTQSLVRHRLVEVEPGLFLADDGETLDLRGPVPTWQSLRLVRVAGGPAAWQWAILAAVALLAALWLVAAAVRSVRRVRSPSTRSGGRRADGAQSPRRWRR